MAIEFINDGVLHDRSPEVVDGRTIQLLQLQLVPDAVIATMLGVSESRLGALVACAIRFDQDPIRQLPRLKVVADVKISQKRS